MFRPCDSQLKKSDPHDFAAPADHWIKLKENEKRDNYLDLDRKLKNL